MAISESAGASLYKSHLYLCAAHSCLPRRSVSIEMKIMRNTGGAGFVFSAASRGPESFRYPSWQRHKGYTFPILCKTSYLKLLCFSVFVCVFIWLASWQVGWLVDFVGIFYYLTCFVFATKCLAKATSGDRSLFQTLTLRVHSILV